MNIIRIKSTGSTNLFLKDLLQERVLEEGTAVLAEFQTSGRGQTGTHWESENGKNIICSIIFYPDFLPFEQRFIFSETIALGVKKALDRYIENVFIKWPNDIYVNDRKIAGILIENEITDRKIIRSIAGIGLNVNQEIFTSNLPNPVSMKQLLKTDLDLDTLSEIMVESVRDEYDILKSGQQTVISKIYHDSLYRKNGFHVFKDKKGQFIAQIQSVGDDGFLYLTTKDNEMLSYSFKEVSFCNEVKTVSDQQKMP
jgi:BirA family biotin operon repressor/biotin-[acetyl-CoA-carboxylase] ligase